MRQTCARYVSAEQVGRQLQGQGNAPFPAPLARPSDDNCPVDLVVRRESRDIAQRPQSKFEAVLVGAVQAEVQQQIFGRQGPCAMAANLNGHGARPQPSRINAVGPPRFADVPVQFDAKRRRLAKQCDVLRNRDVYLDRERPLGCVPTCLHKRDRARQILLLNHEVQVVHFASGKISVQRLGHMGAFEQNDGNVLRLERLQKRAELRMEPQVLPRNHAARVAQLAENFFRGADTR